MRSDLSAPLISHGPLNRQKAPLLFKVEFGEADIVKPIVKGKPEGLADFEGINRLGLTQIGQKR